MVIFLGTLILNKVLFCALLGVGNIENGGAIAPAGGAILLVIN